MEFEPPDSDTEEDEEGEVESEDEGNYQKHFSVVARLSLGR